MNDVPLILTDSPDVTVADAVGQLEAWGLVVAPGAEFLHEVETHEGIRAVLTATDNPTVLRDVVDRARVRGLPVIVACADEAAWRRAVELHADEWYRTPAPAEEIAARLRTALLRARQSGVALADRMGRTGYEHMLYDAPTGLPTLPVMTER